VSAVALAIALAACAGLRAMVPLLLAGVAARMGWLNLGPSFHFLSGNYALLLFGLATVIEIVGDKIPAVDHALDVIHTVLRPLAGSVLAAAALSAVSEPVTALVLGIVLGAPTATVPHMTRAGVRVASTLFTGGLANPLLSILEDVVSVLFFVLAVVVPVVAVLVLVVVALLVTRYLRRRRRRVAQT
jgi:uncharacterized membrane protein